MTGGRFGRRMQIGRSKRRMKRAPAKLVPGVKKTKVGKEVPCFFAVCDISGDKAGPSTGVSETAKRGVLAMLTRMCTCPAKFHFEEESQPRPAVPAKTEPRLS